MTLEIQVLAWDRHKNVEGLNWLMGSQSSPLDNCVYPAMSEYPKYSHNLLKRAEKIGSNHFRGCLLPRLHYTVSVSYRLLYLNQIIGDCACYLYINLIKQKYIYIYVYCTLNVMTVR